MHYRHVFHAGNFADVVKHVLLVGLLQALSRKDKPWLYLDTHAGAGLYDLGSADAQRTGEAADGIARVLAAKAPPPLVADYLALIRAENAVGTDGALRHYPGSPRLALTLARAGDRLACCESVEPVAETLRWALSAAKGVKLAVHTRDGYEAVSLLPPPEKRGLVLIDPPYERVDEYDAVLDFIIEGTRRFSQGVFAAWYPVKNRHAAERFRRRAAQQLTRPVLDTTLLIGAPAEGRMRGTGLLVVNPPFGFAEQAHEALRWLAPVLAQDAGAGFAVTELRGEK